MVVEVEAEHFWQQQIAGKVSGQSVHVRDGQRAGRLVAVQVHEVRGDVAVRVGARCRAARAPQRLLRLLRRLGARPHQHPAETDSPQLRRHTMFLSRIPERHQEKQLYQSQYM